jgi:hypothetical protein
MKATTFPNLFAAIKAEIIEVHAKTIAAIEAEPSIESILGKWYFAELIPESSKRKKWASVEELREYLKKRSLAKTEKRIAKELQHLETVGNAPDLVEITVSVEWKKSRMWGNNPTADAREQNAAGWERYTSGSIGGCGYDKHSTAVAQAVNQSNSFLKAMYEVRERDTTTSLRELFGYGSGYGILPRLEGGVGVSCYPTIFEKIGFKFANTAGGKTFDVHTISKS